MHTPLKRLYHDNRRRFAYRYGKQYGHQIDPGRWYPYLVAITPDGKYTYVTNTATNSVSVIETSTNTLFKTISTPNSPNAVAIGPAETVTFSAFNAKLELELRKKPNHDAFQLRSEFILGTTSSNGIDPVSEAVTLKAAMA